MDVDPIKAWLQMVGCPVAALQTLKREPSNKDHTLQEQHNTGTEVARKLLRVDEVARPMTKICPFARGLAVTWPSISCSSGDPERVLVQAENLLLPERSQLNSL